MPPQARKISRLNMSSNSSRIFSPRLKQSNCDSEPSLSKAWRPSFDYYSAFSLTGGKKTADDDSRNFNLRHPSVQLSLSVFDRNFAKGVGYCKMPNHIAQQFNVSSF